MKQAFTLIELLICISIIAILVAIAIPNFQAAMKDRQLTVTDQNGKITVYVGKVFESDGEVSVKLADGSKIVFDTDNFICKVSPLPENTIYAPASTTTPPPVVTATPIPEVTPLPDTNTAGSKFF